MTFKIQSKDNPYNIMRQAGYRYERTEENKGEMVFVKILAAGGYPRFHAYVRHDKVSGETTVNLHLDQKRPVYKGSAAHGGEYEGKLVEEESERIKNAAPAPLDTMGL